MGCKLKNLLFQDLPIILIDILFLILFIYDIFCIFVTLHRK